MAALIRTLSLNNLSISIKIIAKLQGQGCGIAEKAHGSHRSRSHKEPVYHIPHKESQDQSSDLKISLSKCEITMYVLTVLHIALVNRNVYLLPLLSGKWDFKYQPYVACR